MRNPRRGKMSNRIDEAIEREITVIHDDAKTGNLLSSLFDGSISIVDRVVDNTLIRNAEVVVDTGKKIKNRIWNKIIGWYE